MNSLLIQETISLEEPIDIDKKVIVSQFKTFCGACDSSSICASVAPYGDTEKPINNEWQHLGFWDNQRLS